VEWIVEARGEDTRARVDAVAREECGERIEDFGFEERAVVVPAVERDQFRRAGGLRERASVRVRDHLVVSAVQPVAAEGPVPIVADGNAILTTGDERIRIRPRRRRTDARARNTPAVRPVW
jgi:hypothetical protein